MMISLIILIAYLYKGAMEEDGTESPKLKIHSNKFYIFGKPTAHKIWV
jgi:hypothetical protein